MPGVLPNALRIDAHLNMPHVHDRLRMQAYYFGGACTKRFRQGSDNTRKGVGSIYHMRRTAGHRWGGVCKALSIYWIAAHATDNDFWGWLFSHNGRLNIANATLVCDLQGAYSNDVPYAGGIQTRQAALETKFQFMKRILAESGLVERRSWMDMTLSRHAQRIRGRSSRSRGRRLALAVAPDYIAGQAMYKQLSFRGPAGAHATALWVAEDVMFFDPNFGEFWFETVGAFRRWFEYFWEESTYGRQLSDEYTVHCFGKSIEYY